MKIPPLAPQTVFIAHAMTSALDVDFVQHAVAALRRHFRRIGWKVQPAAGRAALKPVSTISASRATRLLRSNVRAISESQLLLVLVDGAREPSSIWVEVGIALASGIPAVIVGSSGARLPFLVSTAMKGSTQGGPIWHRIITDLLLSSPNDHTHLAKAVVEETACWMAKYLAIQHAEPSNVPLRRD